MQRDFLQHAESDFIYAIIIEELGIGGAIFVAFLYLALLMRVAWIAQRCTTFFPAFRREGKTVFYALDDDHVRSVLALGMEHVLEK